MRQISIAWAGYIGLVTGACFAEHGKHAVGVCIGHQTVIEPAERESAIARG